MSHWQRGILYAVDDAAGWAVAGGGGFLPDFELDVLGFCPYF